MMQPPWPLLLLLWLPATLAQTASETAPEYPPLEQFDDIIERPLFNATRRPKAGDDDSSLSESAAEMREKWRLSGVVWENDLQLALFSEREGEGRQRIRTGMYLDGNWQLEEITEDSVTLTDDGQRLRLELWEPRAPSTRPLPEQDTQQKADEQPEQETDNGDEPETEQGSNGESS
ncbi:type II secretion system protein N [Oceanimonas sp. CHS3-5]|uniref:type II secretion system protein N n=1 Tax=Oceanimonas sp. CHS3-5 TaxID=3068186 RepID=UPI00273D9BD9|nr:type II secretion system protein N [Oceanimonas sp. CHS3-5]MDP5293443.1 type II secretion system protein N [Oceanimonas sp. CHS3-5]